MEGGQRPLELILARNLLASLSTPAFLVDIAGDVAFYNEAAGALLGRRFEDSGPMAAADWVKEYGPFGDDDQPMGFESLDLTEALRGNRPAHDRFCIRSHDGTKHRIELSGVPIVGTDAFRGAMLFFWPAGEEKIG